MLLQNLNFTKNKYIIFHIRQHVSSHYQDLLTIEQKQNPRRFTWTSGHENTSHIFIFRVVAAQALRRLRLFVSRRASLTLLLEAGLLDVVAGAEDDGAAFCQYQNCRNLAVLLKQINIIKQKNTQFNVINLWEKR